MTRPEALEAALNFLDARVVIEGETFAGTPEQDILADMLLGAYEAGRKSCGAKFQASELKPVKLSSNRTGQRFTLSITFESAGRPNTITLKGCLASHGLQGLRAKPPRHGQWESVQWCGNLEGTVVRGLQEAGYLKDLEPLQVISGMEDVIVTWEEKDK